MKKQQRKLILFSQKLETKRDEEKKEICRLNEINKKLKIEISESKIEINQAAERRNNAEKESLSLRLELQQMLDEAQMSDTKKNIIQEEKIITLRDREQQNLTTIEQQKTIILVI